VQLIGFVAIKGERKQIWIDATSLPELSKMSPKGTDRDAFFATLDCISRRA